ncbi:MAG: DUF4258 domain-containing protein [Phormidesmis sp. RL_2_1]|nr:DUF4258 domain-containing protein [Phormidesmis sp. RL_2_1]
MKSLAEIRQQLQSGNYEFTRHAFKRAVERNISEQEIQASAENLEVIEDYPEDKYSPSSLLLGFTQNRRAIHMQVSRAEGDKVKIITLYEPDTDQWSEYKRRKP